MKYERLTMRNKGFIDTNCKNCKQCKKVGRKYICNDMTSCDEEIIERLAELEDKIERGELVDVKENHLIVISRTSGKSSKQLEAVDILAKYENGTLVELPCKVGDTVFVLSQMKDKRILPFINTYEITSITIRKKTIYFYHEMDGFIKIFKLNDFGETVFLTREKAEQKLKELEE